MGILSIHRYSMSFVVVALSLFAFVASAEQLCLSQQLIAEYGPCNVQSNTRKVTYSPIIGLNCTAPPSSDTICACNEKDYTYIFGVCKPDNTRTVVFYLRPEANCTKEGGYTPPPPMTSLPCDVDCQEGQFYDPIAGCKVCTPGSYSVGGGVLIQAWDALPPSFQTTCKSKSYPPGNCSSWATSGEYIDSGNNWDNPNIESSLKTSFTLVKPGYLSFTYMIDAETFPYPYDYFTFAVNDQTLIPRVATKAEWKTVQFNLSEGYHTATWMFSKDTTMSEGSDRVFIREVKIYGTESYASNCDKCPAGSFSDLGASNCTYCDENTYAASTGSTKCLNCPSNTYSRPGASRCTQKPPCTEEDYDFYFTSCAQNKRSKVYEWADGTICDPQHPSSVALPSSESGLPCEPCNPGTYRPSGGACTACPPGLYLSADNSCKPCGAGTAAMRTQYLTYFHSWPNGMKTYCDPPATCGSDGWRLRGTYIDSGSNHGSASVYLQYDFELEMSGTLTFDMSTNCPGFTQCYFSLHIDGRYSSTPGAFNVTNKIYTFDLGIGQHSVVWMFKNRVINSNYHVVIDLISVSGVNEGGATSCINCPAGTFSPSRSSKCSLCEAGFFSIGNATACTACPANTFSMAAGSTECKSCGKGSFSDEGSKSCAASCKWKFDSAHSYDLSPLQTALGTFGPISNNMHQYFINLCDRNILTSTGCQGLDGSPLSSYICQVVSTTSFNLGREMEFSALPDHSEDGFLVRYLDGDEGCYPRRPRRTEIKFTCDPSAGNGYPVGVGNIENPSYSCVYQFQWRSIHACRLCTEYDYTSFYSDCVNGKRNKYYVALQSDRPCYGGIPLPAPEIGVACAPKLTCPAGKYLPEDATPVEASCRECNAGSYSTGPNTDFRYWSTMPHTLLSACTQANCTNWYVSRRMLRSGLGDSRLTYIANLNDKSTPGSVKFKIRVYPNDYGTFNFYINGELQDTYSEHHHAMLNTKEGYSLNKDSNELVWEYINGTSTQFALIESIHITGSSVQTSTCDMCPPGYYSGPGAVECYPCPEGSYSTEYGSRSCKRCPEGHGSFQGQSSCTAFPTCTIDDYYQKKSACDSSGKMNVTYEYFEPKVCVGGYGLPSPHRDTCYECKSGYETERLDGVCQPCEDGTARPSGQLRCGACPPGSAALKKLTLDRFETELADLGFHSWCDGSCGTIWRPHNLYIDSGVNHYGHFETHLEKRFNVYTPGTIRFKAGVVGPSDAFAWVAVDGIHAISIYAGPEQVYSIDVQPGKRLITWGLYGYNRVTQMKLSQIVVVGEASGGSDECQACEPGYFASNNSMTACSPCPTGHFAIVPGQFQCSPCGTNQYADKPGSEMCMTCGTGTFGSTMVASTDCQTSCRFQADDATEFDISSLSQGGKPYKVATLDSGDYEFSLCQRFNPEQAACAESSYACYTGFGGVAFHAGNHLNFVKSSNGFSVAYTNGQKTKRCPDGMKTTIHFTCDATYEKGQPQLNSTDGCIHELAWKSKYGCPVCRPDSYKLVTGVCEGGKRITTHIKTSVCYGDEPTDIEENCDDYAIPTTAVAGSVGVIVALLAAVGYLWHRNRNITEQYTLLRTQAKGNIEMPTLDNDSEDDLA
eukprot:TRINITY_DN1885_c0_g1_i1.p1 TRINITY_DN1885_c0_g1~~TRINITY_DN1885_c0_g1_i1.p1  ORF type:complete len:1610 (+),score=236.23 TRINITY_DN1885_c0_g1_i1:163-4992(+)